MVEHLMCITEMSSHKHTEVFLYYSSPILLSSLSTHVQLHGHRFGCLRLPAGPSLLFHACNGRLGSGPALAGPRPAVAACVSPCVRGRPALACLRPLFAPPCAFVAAQHSSAHGCLLLHQALVCPGHRQHRPELEVRAGT